MTRALLILLAVACSTTSSGAPRTAADPLPAHEPSTASSRPSAELHWEKWGTAAFARAKAERRIIVVAIETQWCHWCHVMEEKTWADPEMKALLADRFIAIKEDADARPDLAERYSDWGWPAIALLSPDGEAITELRGYQEKSAFLARLRALVADLDAGKKLSRIVEVSAAQQSSPSQMQAFAKAQLQRLYDPKEGGWGKTQKYPLWAANDHELLQGEHGDDSALKRALFTLDKQRGLIDAVDGGMFQYSLQGVWTAPHYEKLAEINGTAMSTYARSYLFTRDERWKSAALDLSRYVTTHLIHDSGAFFANQDADVGTRGDRPHLLGKAYYAMDAGGRKSAGAPFIDRNVYALHNGRIISGLAQLAMALDDDKLLMSAEKAAHHIVTRHSIDGGYAHKAGDTALYLSDQLSMGQALLDLYEATLEKRWRAEAQRVALGMISRLWDESTGLLRAHGIDNDSPLEARKPFRQNAEAARFLLKLGRLDDNALFQKTARRILSSLSKESLVKEEGRYVGEFLLAAFEDQVEPLHFAVVRSGPASDAQVRALHKAALALPVLHRLLDVQEEGAKYPELGRAALYICGSTFCSPPMTDAGLVPKKAAVFLSPMKFLSPKK